MMCMPSTRGMDVELSSDAVNAELAQWYYAYSVAYSGIALAPTPP